MQNETMTQESAQQIAALNACRDRMQAEIAKVVVGQTHVIEELLITVFAGGHNLLEGVPGLAKTLMISTLSRLLSLDF